MDIVETIIDELRSQADEEKRRLLPRFFKTGNGEYGEGDVFLGVVVPKIRKIAGKHRSVDADVLHRLLMSEYHEVRMCALLIMVLKCAGADDEKRKELLDFYLSHAERINNWDLVDLSAPTIVGEYLLDKPRDLLYRLAESHLLWENRIAIVSTIALIRNNELDDTYSLALKMMDHRHDLMRKATGWMLREAGKRDPRRLFEFVDEHRRVMPRVMLRYAIEIFPESDRKFLMRK